jgi:hypothetical protein
MKNILALCLLQCFFSFLSLGQTGFMKSYSIGNVQPNGVAILAEEYSYLIVASCDYCLGFTCTGVVETDTNGVKLWDSLYKNDAGYLFPNLSNIKKTPDNSYVISGNSSYAGYAWQNFFLKISSTGDSLKLLEYGGELYDKGGNMALIKGGIISLATTYQIDVEGHSKILKTDYDINDISVIPLPDIENCLFTLSQDISTSPDSNFLYLGIACYYPSYIQGQIRKVDTLGNELWRYSLSGNVEYTNPQMRVKSMPNGNVVIKWFDGVYSSILGQRPYLLCLNSAGDYVWRHDFYSTYKKFIIDIAIAQNGDIIGCGYAYNPGYNYEVGWLFRMSPDGALIWEREYIGYTPVLNFLVPQSITEDHSGNIIATGAIIDATSTGIGYELNSLLLKVLPNGCFTPNCNGGAEDTLIIASTVVGVDSPSKPSQLTSAIGPLVLFPNPTNGVVQILLPVQRQNAEIRFFDQSGRVLKTVPVPAAHYNQHQMGIETDDLPDGMYIVSYEVEGQVFATAKLVVAK